MTSRRFARAALAAIAVLGAAAPSAAAAGTGACADRAFATYFAAWGDLGLYTLAPNGAFEAGLDGWTVTDGARLVEDNPGRIAAQLGNRYALELPPGSSAVSPAICVGSGYPNTRMFANTLQHSPDSGSTLQVEVLYVDSRSGQTVKKLGSVPDRYGWDATRKMSIAQGQLNVKPDSDGHAWIQYRFSPLYSTTWRIDDLYVDPRLRA